MSDAAEDDPTVAIEELRAGRPRRGVVVDPGPLDFGAVPLGRCVIEGQQQSASWDIEGTPQQLEDDGGDSSSLATDAVEEVVVGSEARADPSGPPPTGSGAAAVGQEDAGDDSSESPGGAAMQWSGQSGDSGHPRGGQTDGEHPRPPWCDRGGVATTIVPGGRGLSQDQAPRTVVRIGKVQLTRERIIKT
jgi:hypothetical protein